MWSLGFPSSIWNFYPAHGKAAGRSYDCFGACERRERERERGERTEREERELPHQPKRERERERERESQMIPHPSIVTIKLVICMHP